MSTHDSRLAHAVVRQHGNVRTSQVHRLGASDRVIRRRREQGLLIAVHRGVYRHAAVHPDTRARLHAAVLAGGPAAVASHRSAARLHQLRGVPLGRPEITVPGTRLPRHRGITLHRSNLLEALDVTSIDGIPVTTLARTLLDLGAVVPFEVVELAAQDALVEQRTSTTELICTLERVGRRGRRGTAALRAVVAASLPADGVDSRLELALLRLVESCPVPPPVLQHEIVVAGGGRYRLDEAWPDLRIAVEADGRRWHSTRRDFERDLARVRAITAAGWSHYRYGWADVHQHAPRVRAELTAVITASLAVHA
jgi:predicted transcriptional regulator of viral defense system